MFTERDIQGAFSHTAFRAGRYYAIGGRVQDLRTTGDGIIEGAVQGSDRMPYRQTVRLTPGRAGVSVKGSCTCPVGSNCKHVAAVLLAFRKRPGMGEPGLLFATTGLQANVATEEALPGDVVTWLANLGSAQEPEHTGHPPTIRKRLVYVFKQEARTGSVRVELEAYDAKKDGTVVAPTTQYRLDQLLHPTTAPKFVRPSDQAILRQLRSFQTRDEEFALALQLIFASGSGRWGKWDGPALTKGGPVNANVTWTVQSDGRQLPALEVAPPMLALRLATPWYVDPATGVMGLLETGLPTRLIRAVLAAPALPPSVARRVHAEIGRRWPDRQLPAPAALAPPTPLKQKPRPMLRLASEAVPADIVGFYRTAAGAVTPPGLRKPVASLSWCYGPVTLPTASSGQLQQTIQHAGVLFEVFRDNAAERNGLDRLRLLGFRASYGYYTGYADRTPSEGTLVLDDPDGWIEFMLEDVPQLRAEGWQVEVADDFPVRLVEPESDLSFELREGSGIDWFDLDFGVVVGGERVNLIPALLAAIQGGGVEAITVEQDDQDKLLLLPMPDGRLLTIKLQQLEPILAPLIELFAGSGLAEAEGLVRVSRRDAGDIALLEAASANAGIAWSGGDAVRALGRQLREHGGIPACPVPDGFAATLRPYQADGLAWLQMLRAAGLGGVLADDMGLGKTVQALAHIATEQAHGRLDRPALVVCPTSLVPNWRAEATRFAPRLRTLVLHGPDRAARFGDIAGHDLVITTYPLLARDHAVLTAQDWSIVTLDEAQTIKNPLATTSKLARGLRAGQRLCLSGTPLENHLGELWSLFDFLSPGFLGDRQSFGRRFRGPIEKGADLERQGVLARRVAPFLLRRTKAEVATDLPPKSEIAERVQMEDAQQAIYEGIRLAMHAKVRAAIAERGLAGSGIVILDAMLKLRQVCCDPRLLKLATAKAAKAKSAKLERLLELLPQLLEEGRRVLLFSQFTSMLALIEAELAAMGQPYVLLTGDTKDRAEPVRRFQSGEVPLFLISLKAGGTGLNLTAADTVIHYDPWWNPAVEDQATDRAHRIGQDKPVFVHKLITAGTIEEKMVALKERKQALAAGVLGASGGDAAALTEGDLDALFAPIG